MYGFSNVCIFHKDMANPILKKKIPKLFFMKILFFLLCNRCPIRSHEIECNTVSQYSRKFEVNIFKSMRFMITNDAESSGSATNVAWVLNTNDLFMQDNI